MKLPITIRGLAALLTMISLLFMQLAIASYVCPLPSSTPTIHSNSVAMQMPCNQSDHMQPGLCHARASDIGNKLSLDIPDTPFVDVFLPVTMAQTIDMKVVDTMVGNQRNRADVHVRATSPPTLLLHCCFLI